MYAGTLLYFVYLLSKFLPMFVLLKNGQRKIFKTFFKYNDNGEQKFCNFNQLTPIGKRITFIILNKALGASKVKTTVNWLREKRITSNCFGFALV